LIAFLKPIDMDNKDERRDFDRDNENDASVKPDAETLHTKDPQKNMEGPVSSVTRKTGEVFETDETKEEADQKRDEHM
jgi:hypothetical protein